MHISRALGWTYHNPAHPIKEYGIKWGKHISRESSMCVNVWPCIIKAQNFIFIQYIHDDIDSDKDTKVTLWGFWLGY